MEITQLKFDADYCSNPQYAIIRDIPLEEVEKGYEIEQINEYHRKQQEALFANLRPNETGNF